MIGLLGSENSQINKLKEYLPDSDYVHINTKSFPESPKISITTDGIEYKNIDQEITVYYVDAYHSSVKRPFKKEDIDEIEVDRRFVFATAEKDSFLRSVLKIEHENGKLVVNRPDIKNYHYLKPHQLFKLRQSGLPVPESIHTNDPTKVRELFNQHSKLAYKPIGGLARVDTHTLSEFEQRKETLSRAPVTFQEFCEGDNLRVYVLDDEVIGGYRILSNKKVVDYRGYERDVKPVNVSDYVSQISIKATQALDMRFSGVDIIKTEQGATILECNSGPHFAGVEEYTKSEEISRSLADFLCRHHR
jgi:ribosomal protein S6--L-glutamate ligase